MLQTEFECFESPEGRFSISGPKAVYFAASRVGLRRAFEFFARWLEACEQLIPDCIENPLPDS